MAAAIVIKQRDLIDPDYIDEFINDQELSNISSSYEETKPTLIDDAD